MEKTGKFYFDPDDAIYKDHFPGSPVVPGSLIIHAFCRAIEKEDEDQFNNNQLRVEKFRFTKFVTPGEYRYTLLFTDNPLVAGSPVLKENLVKCSLYDGQIQVAAGTLIL